MEANDFIAKLKANGTEKDQTNLEKVYESYKSILSNLPTKDKGLFSLNLLCTICRNLDKIPKWKDLIDWQYLLTLSIDCVRETRSMERGDRVKVLAAIFHIHKHAVRQQRKIPPELILKMSYMPFEVDSKHLLTEHSKTYWNIMIDRLTYLEKLKHIPTVKLLPKLTEHLLKIMDVYDIVPFCSNILVFLFKKLFHIFEGCRKELNGLYVEIFKKLSLEKNFKNLKETELLDLYVKFNECLFVVVENSSKLNFKEFPLDTIVRCCIVILGHSPDLFHCFQTFYSNAFCLIYTSDNSYTQTVLNGLLISFKTTERLGYNKAMMATYPFLNKLLTLYVENNVTNHTKRLWKDYFDITTQEMCLKIMLILMKKQKDGKQLLKCENCQLKSGLHDSLRLSFLLRNFITIPLTQNLLLTDNQPVILSIIDEQYNILTELKTLGCANSDKCFRKHQTDVHNCAISLNKAKYYEFSIKLFKIYLKFEISYSNVDFKNITRALYNKSICELDSKLYEDALLDAFLSLILAQNEAFTNNKYMSLIMDIKCKEIKNKMAEDLEEDKQNELQHLTVIDAWNLCSENDYSGFKNLLQNMPFVELLEHEFKSYSKLWPSMAPIAGIWTALLQIYHRKYDNIIQVDQETVFWKLSKMILETASTVRTMHNETFQNIVVEFLGTIEHMKMTTDLQIIHSALLFLNTEYTLAAASTKYGWKTNEIIQTSDPDQIPANRTLPQEHNALLDSFKALDILRQVAKQLHKVKNADYLRFSLPIYQVFVYQFLQLSRLAQGLQLAYICCQIAEFIDDTASYIKNAGVILYHSVVPCPELEEILKKSVTKYTELKGMENLEEAIIFLCETSIYYTNIGSIRKAAKLIQLAQAKLLFSQENHPEINVDMAIGRLMEAQTLVCKSGPSVLTAVNGIHRHYLGISSTGTKWTHRRAYTLSLRHYTATTSLLCINTSRKLYLCRRAVSAACACLQPAGAVVRAKVYLDITDPNTQEDAQMKIDNRLKHILGLKPTNEIQPYYAPIKKQNTSQMIEPVREHIIFKKNSTSPSLPCVIVPSFKIYDYLLHDSNCACYACSLPVSFLIACKISTLEASMYFRAGEHDIAENYFEGTLKMFNLVEKKFLEQNCESFLEKNCQKILLKDLKEAEIEVLIELSFFELKMKRYDDVDDNLVKIHEIHQELGKIDDYLEGEILNLMVASSQLRKVITKPKIEDLEIEFDKLKLSPNAVVQTPMKKSKIPKEIKKIVKEEEIFKKRKVIKLNLEDNDDDFEVPKKKTEFKIPEPKLSKPSLELATPIPKTSKKPPNILVTQPTEDESPKSEKNEKSEFFTPYESPEQFFTPMSKIKTYTKKTLRQNIVKNLESEFSTPKTVEKDNLKAKTDNIEQVPMTKVKTVSKNNTVTKAKTNTVEKENLLKVKNDTNEKSLKDPSAKVKASSSKAKTDTLEKENSLKAKTTENSLKTTSSKAKTDIENENLLKIPSKAKTDPKKHLRRATSPGKLCKTTTEKSTTAKEKTLTAKEKSPTKTRRLRRTVLSLDEEDKK